MSPYAWETPVQGLDSPDGLGPGDGEWLYSHPAPPQKNTVSMHGGMYGLVERLGVARSV